MHWGRSNTSHQSSESVHPSSVWPVNALGADTKHGGWAVTRYGTDAQCAALDHDRGSNRSSLNATFVRRFENCSRIRRFPFTSWTISCLLYTSDAADERSSVDLGGRRI